MTAMTVIMTSMMIMKLMTMTDPEMAGGAKTEVITGIPYLQSMPDGGGTDRHRSPPRSKKAGGPYTGSPRRSSGTCP